METYKVIEGFEGYSISDHGNVKNNKTGRVLARSIDTYGYERSRICKNYKSYSMYVHKL